MKRILSALFMGLLLAAGYVALPFWTAFSIREAVKSGDTSYLDSKIEWASVRTTLRQSLADHALDLPDAVSASASDPEPSRGLWQRIKDYAGKRAIDTFVDRYVSADGFARLHRYRSMYREKVRGETDEPSTMSRLERIRHSWARIIRAEFHSLTEFEIEQRDRFDAARSYVGLLKLQGFTWKLTELRMRSLDALAPLASVR